MFVCTLLNFHQGMLAAMAKVVMAKVVMAKVVMAKAVVVKEVAVVGAAAAVVALVRGNTVCSF